MFDVSFSELMVIAVVALIVIGPEKLPKVARMLGHLTGRVQRYVANVKEDINREMQFEDLQKLQQEIKQSVEYSQNSILNHTQAFENTFKETAAKETIGKESTNTAAIFEPSTELDALSDASDSVEHTEFIKPVELEAPIEPKKLVKRPRKPRATSTSVVENSNATAASANPASPATNTQSPTND